MNINSSSYVRAHMSECMDSVCEDSIPLVITRRDGGHVVMISLDDYNAMKETIYLLSSAENVKRLKSSIAQIKEQK